MLRGLLSIGGVLLIAGSLVVIVPLLILPNTFLHQLVPYLAPLHQSLACNAGETIDYDTFDRGEGYETHYLCVDARGTKRDVDNVLLRPAYLSLGTLCLGGLLLIAPLGFAIRQGLRGETGPEMQAALQQSYEGLRKSLAEINQSGAAEVKTVAESTAQGDSIKQQLAALEQQREQGLISQPDYDAARKQILDQFGGEG